MAFGLLPEVSSPPIDRVHVADQAFVSTLVKAAGITKATVDGGLAPSKSWKGGWFKNV